MITDKLIAAYLAMFYMITGICYGFWSANSGYGEGGGFLYYLFYPPAEVLLPGRFIGGFGAWLLSAGCEVIIFILMLGVFLLLIKGSRMAFQKKK